MSIFPNYTADSRQAGRAPVEMTDRKDTWWVEPLMFILVFGAFVLYTTYRMFENADYLPKDLLTFPHNLPYLSPYYSPILPLDLSLNIPLLGLKKISPAIYILIFPLSFRMSCYYYRKAYYRAFFADPAGCAVTEPFANKRMHYMGERVLLPIVNNFHRYAFYAAFIFILILGWDTIVAFLGWEGEGGGHRFGIGVGSILFLVNWVLLTAYTLGCHSWRHLIGGKVDCYSCTALTKTRYGVWQKVSYLNARHALFAWASMISVGLTDLYVNLVSKGIITDLHHIF